jgi:hypothetical protein
MADLNDLDRQQRDAYWKGELEAESRLPLFTPRNPLAGAALDEAERIEAEMDRLEEAIEAYEWEQYVKHYGLDEGTPAEQVVGVYGEEYLDEPQEVLDRTLTPSTFRGGGPSPEGGYKTAGFSDVPKDAGGYPIPGAPAQTYTTPATHMGTGPALAANIPEDLRDPEWEAMMAEEAENK